MSNRFLWISLIVVGASYFVSSMFKELNNSLISALKFEDNLPHKLSLINTSPRWKYPNALNSNCSLDSNGDFIFPTSNIPIVSIIGNEVDFFGYSKGIYCRGKEELRTNSKNLPWWEWSANYRNRGKEWEKEVEIQFIGFGIDNLTQKAGVRINGNATRAFPQKSLRLIFRDEYQKDGIDNIFFSDQVEYKYNTLILRNGGNDWDRAMLRDVLVSDLSENLFIETQEAIACNLYLNGEYWGIHYLRPKMDDSFLANRYQIKVENISILESPLQVYRGDSAGLRDFQSLLHFLEVNDLKDSIKFNFVSQNIDIQSFIDYLIVQSIIVNTDWPQNNWMIWKDISNNSKYGKWKWILKDTDYGLGFFNNKAFSFSMNKKIISSKSVIGIIFRNLIVNSDFNERYNEKLNQVLMNDWSIESFDINIMNRAESIRPEMQKQINRWRTHLSIKDWENEVDEIREFYSKRLMHIKKENNL